MPERDMSITTCSSLGKLLLTLLRCLVVPVTAVNVISDDAVAKRLPGREHAAASGVVWWAYICRLHTTDVDNGLLKTRDYARAIGCALGAEVLKGVSQGLGIGWFV